MQPGGMSVNNSLSNLLGAPPFRPQVSMQSSKFSYFFIIGDMLFKVDNCISSISIITRNTVNNNDCLTHVVTLHNYMLAIRIS